MSTQSLRPSEKKAATTATLCRYQTCPCIKTSRDSPHDNDYRWSAETKLGLIDISDVRRGQISVGTPLIACRIRWDAVWAVSLSMRALRWPQVIGLPPWSSFCETVSGSLLNSQARCRTGVARNGIVCRMKSCGLALMKACWVGRIIIMRVGCIARTRVAWNMVSDVDRSIGGVERRRAWS